MFTQPNAEYQTTTFDQNGNAVSSWGPVPPNLWQYFSTQSQAQTLFDEQIKKLSSDAVLDGLNVDLWIPVRYLDDTTKIWVYHGTVVIGKDPCAIDEYAGSLWDRRVKPNPFVDQRPTLNLHATPITVDGASTGIAQLSWGA